MEYISEVRFRRDHDSAFQRLSMIWQARREKHVDASHVQDVCGNFHRILQLAKANESFLREISGIVLKIVLLFDGQTSYFHFQHTEQNNFVSLANIATDITFMHMAVLYPPFFEPLCITVNGNYVFTS